MKNLISNIILSASGMVIKMAILVLTISASNSYLNAQCYEQLFADQHVDLVGVNKINANSTLHSLACEINTKLAGGFTVYDATFYTVSEYSDGIEALELATEGEIKSPSYLLVYKITDSNGYNNRYKVKLKLPLVDGCLNESNLNIKAQELELYLRPFLDFESDMEFLLEKFRDYINYMVDECCYQPTPPADCGGNVCDLRESLVDEIEFEDEFMVDFFNGLPNTIKCKIQVGYDYSQGSDGFKEEIRFALYYRWLVEGDPSRMMRVNIPQIQQCVEDSGIKPFFNDYENLINLYQKAFELSESSVPFNIRTVNKNTDDDWWWECYYEKGKEFVKASKEIVNGLEDWSRLALGSSTYFTVGKMIFSVLYSLSPFQDVQDIVDGFAKIDMGDFVSGATMVVLGAVSLGATFFPWAKIGTFLFETFKFVRHIANSGVIRWIKATATAFANVLQAGANMVFEAGEFVLKNISNTGGKVKYYLWCTVLGKGCFIKDTPVLVANTFENTSRNPFKLSAKSFAVAAAMPIVAVPIQDVQLLDYAVAHETVNSTYGLTASVGGETYEGLIEDPYTSDQQRERDEYEINDRDWNEVVFEEVHGTSTAKFALHSDWITQKGYAVDGVVNLNLPEQGINGPFRITSIRHILPQKKPTDDDESDDYDYRPVTALFTHESNQVYDIDFDNGESLGVTYQHPIYSVTAGDWRLAGELEVGEEVLTKSGNTKVVSSVKKEGSETVYNLEVKELHNFLVGESGIVVHNGCGNVGDILDTFLSGIHAATKAFHKNYMCEPFSKALRAYYKSKGHNIKTTRIELVKPNGKVAGEMSYIDANGKSFQISNNGYHEYTIINNKIFDNNNPNGVLDSEFYAKFAVDISAGQTIRFIDIVD